jgi:hypothetical protein
LADDSGAIYTGHVERISATMLTDLRELTGPVAPVRIDIDVDSNDLSTGRPGMTADVRIDCGRRSLGYVWLHDPWAMAIRWISF